MNKPKLKKSASSKTDDKNKTLLESAQQIWLAGLGAFSRAQAEGSKLFDALVKEGSTVETKTRHFTAEKASEVRSAMESTVGQVRERAADTWDKLEKVFEDRVSRSLGKLGVPNRDDMKALLKRVEELNRTVSKMNATDGKAGAKAKPKATVKKAATTRKKGTTKA